MRKQRVLPALGVILALAIFPLTGVADAGGPPEPPPLYNESFLSVPATVNGSYEPLVGNFVSEDLPDVLWYGAGGAADYLWTDVRPNETSTGVDHGAMAVTVNGTYQPFVLDFDSDGFDDIFWYAPGPAADYVWYFNNDGTHDSYRTQVNGTYQPVPGVFPLGDVFPAIFWYAPGSGTESFWHQNTNGEAGRGQFVSSPAPQVNGTYDVTAFNARSISAFNGGGMVFVNASGQDFVWSDVEPGISHTSESADLGDGAAQVFSGPDNNGSAIIYRPGSPADVVVSYDSTSTSVVVQDASVNGSYRAASGLYGPIVWHAPGTARDYFWFPLDR